MARYPHAQSTIKPPTSSGTCFICNSQVTGDTMEEHLKACIPSLNWPEGDEESLLLRVVDKYSKKYWLYILASPEATLKDLDSCLKDVWVACCGHLSDFSIGRVFFSSDGVDEDMYVYIKDVLKPGDEVVYRYDFGSTTTLRINVLKSVPICPPDKQIVLLGRNRKAHHVCTDCKAEADYSYQKGGEGKTLYFCSDCLKNHEIDDENCSYLNNSPRAGICGCTKGDGDGLSWHPHAEPNANSKPGKNKKPIRRFNREDLSSGVISDVDLAILKVLGLKEDRMPKQSKPRKKKANPILKSVPSTITPRYYQIQNLCIDFCKSNPDLNMEKPVLELLSLIARIPYTEKILDMGTEQALASGFIYAIGQMMGLFTRGREKGLKSNDIGDFFGVNGDSTKGRAYLIRTELRKVKRAWTDDYEGSLFDGQVDDDWAELMDEWVGDGRYGMRKPLY